jgi:hypothetical protein
MKKSFKKKSDKQMKSFKNMNDMHEPKSNMKAHKMDKKVYKAAARSR